MGGGVAIASGLAVGISLDVLGALFRGTEFGVRLTIGWWIDLAAMVLSVASARRLATRRHRTILEPTARPTTDESATGAES